MFVNVVGYINRQRKTGSTHAIMVRKFNELVLVMTDIALTNTISLYLSLFLLGSSSIFFECGR